MLLKRKVSTYTYHFALWITLYTTQLLAQRLVTTSARLRALKLDYAVLFFQVLNIKSLLPNGSVTSVCNNLEHGLVTLTESLRALRSVLHNLPCWSPKQKCALSHAIPFYTMYTWTRLNRFSPASASHSQPVRLTWSANCVAGNSHWDADVTFNCYFDHQMICIEKTRGWGRCVVYKMNPLHTSPFWLNIVLDVSEINNYTTHTYYTIILCG